jgi:hypothetical protein
MKKKKIKVLFFPTPSNPGKAMIHFKVARLCPPVLQITAA